MNLRFMQLVDYWAGTLLCFLTAQVHRFIPERSKKETPEKILFIELSEMGSALLAAPAIQSLMVEDRNSEDLYFLIFQSNRESVDLLDIIPKENVLTIDDTNFFRFTLSSLRTLRVIRKLQFDAVIDLELFSRFTALLTILSGAPVRIGFHNFREEGLYRGNFLTHQVSYNPFQHIASNFLALTKALDSEPKELPLVKIEGLDTSPKGPRLSSFPSEVKECRVRLFGEERAGEISAGAKQLVILNPDPGRLILRGWPARHYRTLAAKILQEKPLAYIAVIGVEETLPLAEEILEALPSERVTNLCGLTRNWKDVLHLAQSARVFVTGDSGPAHLAAAAQVPTVVLFGPESPKRYAPLGDEVRSISLGLHCSPCFSAQNHRRSICTNNLCLKNMTPERVYPQVAAFLG